MTGSSVSGWPVPQQRHGTRAMVYPITKMWGGAAPTCPSAKIHKEESAGPTPYGLSAPTSLGSVVFPTVSDQGL